MPLIASDGYEYEDLKARLLGRPCQGPRNQALWKLRASGYPETYIRAWIKEFDQCTAFEVGSYARRLAATRYAEQSLFGGSRTRVPTPESPTPAPLHPAHQPAIPCGLGA